jgi:hypothetical protein
MIGIHRCLIVCGTWRRGVSKLGIPQIPGLVNPLEQEKGLALKRGHHVFLLERCRVWTDTYGHITTCRAI